MHQQNPFEKIDIVFLSMLNRYPTRGEKKLWMKEGAEHGMEAAKDLIWTLCNTTEFLFIQ